MFVAGSVLSLLAIALSSSSVAFGAKVDVVQDAGQVDPQPADAPNPEPAPTEAAAAPSEEAPVAAEPTPAAEADPTTDPASADGSWDATTEAAATTETPPTEPPAATAAPVAAAPAPAAAPADTRPPFLHRGPFVRPGVGFAMCTSDVCQEILTAFGGELSGGYRFPYVGVGALVMAGGGGTQNPSSTLGDLERAGMNFVYAGALVQFVPVQQGRFSPNFDLSMGYVALIDWATVDGENIWSYASRLGVAVGGGLDIFVHRRVAIGPSFHYVFTLAGDTCTTMTSGLTGLTEGERECQRTPSDYADMELDGPERRADRRDRNRVWLASVGVTINLGSFKK